jgi:hypothetical protein
MFLEELHKVSSNMFRYLWHQACLYLLHRYLRNLDCSSFVMCLLLALALPRVLLQQPLTVLTRQTMQAVHAIYQSIFYMMSMICGIKHVYNSVAVAVTFIIITFIIMNLMAMLSMKDTQHNDQAELYK